MTLSNAKGATYSRAIGEVIVKSSASGVTYRSTEALALASGPGTTATIALVADVAGSEGSVGVNDIDEIVTTMLGVTATASTAAVGIDEQSDASLADACLATLGSVSVNGPPDAYVAVCLDSTLTGTSSITRAATSTDDTGGAVDVWIARASGAVSSGVVALAQDAVETWATPAGFTPTVYSATNSAQTTAFTVNATGVPATASADIEALVVAYYAALAIGGFVSRSALHSLVYVYLAAAGASDIIVTVTAPAGGTLTEGYVATLDTCTVTEV